MLLVLIVGGVQIGIMVVYIILIEIVFQWLGMGFLFLEVINCVDMLFIIVYVIFVGLIFVVINMIVDFLYGLINLIVNFIGKGV